jgi:hypothetical protein
MPNTAITASPMNFSTLAPWRSRTPRAVSKYRDISLRVASGSSRSPSAVDPVTSQKSTDTVLRTSRAGVSLSSGEPQLEQNRAPASFSLPQLGHAAMCRV